MCRYRAVLSVVFLLGAIVATPGVSAKERIGTTRQPLEVVREVFVSNAGNVPVNYQWRSNVSGQWKALTLEPGAVRRHFCEECDSDNFFFKVKTEQQQPVMFSLAVGSRHEFYYDVDRRQWRIRKSSEASKR